MTKHFVVTAAVIGAMALTAGLPAMAAEGSGRPVCIRSYDIDHTETPNDNTILFYMHGHKLFKADMVNRCVGLRNNTRGFTYQPTNPGTDEICSNLLTIHLNDTGQVCLVGAITPVEAPAGKTSP
ncbi:MAG: hypothetical protein JWM91_1138 [Rhodospirillales bacterium]|nr:hypothetical protein [Rhodospirillales bacterium]